jgi:hypothetical protein
MTGCPEVFAARCNLAAELDKPMAQFNLRAVGAEGDDECHRVLRSKRKKR